MATISEVSNVLREAYQNLPNRDVIKDVAYLLDVDPYGADSLVIYITTADEQILDPSRKRAIEAALRMALSKDLDYNVYFRWQTENERVESHRDVTESELIDQPHSALG